MILSQCLAASEKEIGIFSLTVPTGGGKTLSSMAFALRHAIKHRLCRVIYVIPFTSIIEQNAAVFRSMLGNDSVLEHHSNFEPEFEDHHSRLAAENWDAPIIVTTNVQFFDSLFANRSSRCRKLHNISDSVVILDEVQTLPAQYLLPCLEVLKELVSTYRASIVLCSATQPAVQWRQDFDRGLKGATEIVIDPQKLAHDLKRTEVHVMGKLLDKDLASQLTEYEQVLCVVNTRNHARKLYQAIPSKDGLIHLSALMCPVHRSQKLDEVRQRLKNGLTCCVVSTQLVEAGVDIDFPVVYRSLAGIDSIAQAAGRCNREGKLERGQVFVFTPENGIPVGYLRQTAQAAESVIRRYPEEILSLEAIEDYFRNYYWIKGDGLDEDGILAMLHAGCQKGDFPFKTIAEKFRFIKDDTKSVIIPYNDYARSLISNLDYCKHPMALSRKLQKYTVSIYPNEWNRLLSIGGIELEAGLFPVLKDYTLYDENLGLCADDPTARNPETLIA
jgi:CRISPR-associated endonuclease/helicase Cas3